MLNPAVEFKLTFVLFMLYGIINR